MEKTQLQFVKERLDTVGFVTRNQCLNNRITRLAAIISRLKLDGYPIVARRVPKGDKQWDYRYEIENYEKKI